MTHPILDRIILNENAYFLKKEVTAFYTATHINDLFVAASVNKTGNYLLNLRKQTETIDGENIEYSICVFKFTTSPSFIDQPIPKWEEQKLAYLLVVDFQDHVFISKKNISGVDDLLLRELSPIDYATLVSLFVDGSTNFEKFSLNNTSVSYDAIKGKTVEANDLKKSFSAFGAGKYVLNSVRLNNDDEKTSIAFNTSRISNFGEKKYLSQLLTWAWETVEKIRHHVHTNSFLNIFAEPIEYEKNRADLKPISFLFNLTRFNDDIEKNEIISCEHFLEVGRSRIIPIKKILSFLKNVFSVEEEIQSGDTLFILKNSFVNDVVVNLNRKSITLSSKKAKNLIIKFNDGTSTNFLHYFNLYNDFIINFEDLSLVYTNRKLFKDSKLIGYIDNFIDIFKGKTELTTVTSEKGIFTATSTTFSNESIFNFIENHLTHNSDYSFLDDLGDEWADFIKLKNNSISLIHAKFGDSQLSASSFHDVVGQALKNIGNLNPSSIQLDTTKTAKWNATYNIDTVFTAINRLRHGDTIANAINTYKSLLVTPNLNKEIILVINFISRAQLKDRLQRLQAGTPFREKNQVIQILWITSSLVNSCVENGIDIHIYCKP